MAAICYFSYTLYGDLANLIYWANVIMLLLVLLMAEVGRGGMTAFSSGAATAPQPSEFGKTATIIALANCSAAAKSPFRPLASCSPCSFT